MLAQKYSCNLMGREMSVSGHALRCGPETSVTSPLRRLWFELSGHEKTYNQSSRPWECGNPEGISKECGKGGKPASWLSMLSILCHFHGLLFARQMLDKPICRLPVQCAHSLRAAHRYSSLVKEVAVGTIIADRPPHRSVRALISAYGSYLG